MRSQNLKPGSDVSIDSQGKVDTTQGMPKTQCTSQQDVSEVWLLLGAQKSNSGLAQEAALLLQETPFMQFISPKHWAWTVLGEQAHCNSYKKLWYKDCSSDNRPGLLSFAFWPPYVCYMTGLHGKRQGAMLLSSTPAHASVSRLSPWKPTWGYYKKTNRELMLTAAIFNWVVRATLVYSVW